MGLDTTFGSAEVETEYETLVTITSTVYGKRHRRNTIVLLRTFSRKADVIRLKEDRLNALTGEAVLCMSNSACV
jgi:hypothetical protein